MAGVNRTQKALVLLAVLALPAAAPGTLPSSDSLCFASGSTTYRIAADAPAPDYRVRFDRDASQPDLRMQLVDRVETADFVLVDDFGGSQHAACAPASPVQTIKIDLTTPLPDVTVHLSADPGAADFKLYVHSVRFSHQDAAALLAAMWKAGQRGNSAALSSR